MELANAGYKIYIKCDEQARDILDDATHSGNLDLRGEKDKDPHRTNLVEQIIKIVATESVREKKSRKVSPLNDISSCIR